MKNQESKILINFIEQQSIDIEISQIPPEVGQLSLEYGQANNNQKCFSSDDENVENNQNFQDKQRLTFQKHKLFIFTNIRNYCQTLRQIQSQKCQKDWKNYPSQKPNNLSHFQQYFRLKESNSKQESVSFQNNRQNNSFSNSPAKSQGNDFSFQDQTNIINSVKINQNKLKKQLQQKIIKSKVFQKCQSFTTDLLILQIIPSKHFEIVTLQIQLLNFKTKVIILNELEKHPFNEYSSITSFGSFGNIYYVNFLHQTYAIKSIPIKSSLQTQKDIKKKLQTFQSVLKQYFFLLLFSCLQIGPKVKKIFGFDLIVTPYSFSFSTEICKQYMLNSIRKDQLLQNLRSMHALKIIHRDIKPSNIMFSETYKKCVFIDFGGSHVVKQQIGYKSTAYFLGTTGFCSEQMIRLLGKHAGFVDLYYNDVYGLKMFLLLKQTAEFQEQKFEFIKKQKQINLIHSPVIFLLKIKYLLYQKQYQEFKQIWKIMTLKYNDEELEQIYLKILRFFIELQSNKNIRQFYWKQIPQDFRNLEQFQQLKSILINSSHKFFQLWKFFPFKETMYQQYKAFYQRIVMAYSGNTFEQKKLSKILMDKKSIQHFIFEENRTAKLFSLSPKQQFYYLCLIVVDYCTFSQNKYNADIQSRLKACQTVFKRMQSCFGLEYSYSNIIFKSQIRELTLITQFFLLFLLEIWKYLPQKFKQQSLQNCLSSLCLLGYPFYLEKAKYFIINNLIAYQLQKNQKILIFWKVIAIFSNFQKVYYQKAEQNFYLKINQIELEGMKQNLISIMKPRQSENEFQQLNYYFFIQAFLVDNFQNKGKLANLLSKLHETNSLKEIVSIKYLQKWKQNLYIILISLYADLTMNENENEMQLIKLFRPMDRQNHTLPLYFGSLIGGYHDYDQINKLQEILKIIDSIISYQPISIRFATCTRLQMAYRNNQAQNVEKITSIFYQIIFKITIYNISSIRKVMTIIKRISNIINNQIWKQKKYSINLLNILQSLIKKSEQYAYYFTQNQRLNQLFDNCQNKFQINLDKNSEIYTKIKSIVFLLTSIIYTCHAILITLKQSISSDNYKQVPNQILKHTLFGDFRQSKKMVVQMSKCMRKLMNNKFTQFYLKNNKVIKNQFTLCKISLLDDDRHNASNIHVIIQNAYGSVQTIDLSDKKIFQNPQIPSYKIIALYYMSKIQSSRHENFYYGKFIQVYKLFTNETSDMIIQITSLRFIFNAFVYCNKSYQQIQHFFVSITGLLKKYQGDSRLVQFHQHFQTRFSCKCAFCFPKQPQNWNPVALIEYFYDNIKLKDPASHCYMALVYFYCLRNEQVKIKVCKKFLIFISKAMQFLKFHSKQIINQKLYFYRWKIINQNKKYVNLFQQKDNLLIFCQLNETETSRLLNQEQQKGIDKQYYFFEKNLRNQQRMQKLQEMVKKRLLFKKKYKKNCKIPKFIQTIYIKKIKNYHKVKQNYVN